MHHPSQAFRIQYYHYSLFRLVLYLIFIMSPKYQNVQWIVQQNLTSKEDFEGLMGACEKPGINFYPVTIVMVIRIINNDGAFTL